MYMICRLDVEFSLFNLSMLIVVHVSVAPTFLHLSILISSAFELYRFNYVFGTFILTTVPY